MRAAPRLAARARVASRAAVARHVERHSNGAPRRPAKIAATAVPAAPESKQTAEVVSGAVPVHVTCGE
jgi:hypothetical protein